MYRDLQAQTSEGRGAETGLTGLSSESGTCQDTCHYGMHHADGCKTVGMYCVSLTANYAQHCQEVHTCLAYSRWCAAVYTLLWHIVTVELLCVLSLGISRWL